MRAVERWREGRPGVTWLIDQWFSGGNATEAKEEKEGRARDSE